MTLFDYNWQPPMDVFCYNCASQDLTKLERKECCEHTLPARWTKETGYMVGSPPAARVVRRPDPSRVVDESLSAEDLKFLASVGMAAPEVSESENCDHSTIITSRESIFSRNYRVEWLDKRLGGGGFNG